MIVQILFPRRPDLFTQEGKPVDCENTSSAFQRYSMQWCADVLRLAGENISLDSLPVLDHRTRSRTQPLITVPKTSLWNHILAERRYGFVKQWALMLIRSVVTFGSPYCVMRLLKSLEDKGGASGTAWIWLIGIGASSTCETVLHHHLAWIQWSEMGIPVRAQLIMAIFQKALRIKDAKEPKSSNSTAALEKPEAVNLISSDTLSFSKFTAVNYILPFSFIKFFFAILFLIRLLGWRSTLIAISATVASVPISTIVIKQERTAQKKLTVARDKKTKAVTEALHALRQIKFYVLENQWENRIEILRQEEIKYLRTAFIASNIRSVWKIAAPLIVAAASICTYAYVEGSVSPSIIFPMIELLPHLQGTLGFLPVVFQDYFGARSNAHRMDQFLKRAEQKTNVDASPSGHVIFRNASIAWPSDGTRADINQEKQVIISPRFILHNINLDFPSGELSIIHGKTGCGKSLLLAAILGEVDIIGGRIEAPSMADGHPVAFVSQTPWLQNATVKDNILFGSPLDQKRYEQVLRACALNPDLSALPEGDDTQIGLRGVKLSGGQRMRLSFARALYSNTEILVLDDIFSALDTHVSKEIFNALTSKLCEGRTRILVTHQVSLCLPKTKYIVDIQNNTVAYAGTTDRIDDAVDIAAPEDHIETIPPVEESSKKCTLSKTKTTGKNLSARTDANVYKRFFAAAGGFWFTSTYLLSLVAKQLLGALTTWSLGRINSARPKTVAEQPGTVLPPMAVGGHRLYQYLYVYLLISLLAVVLEFLSNLHTFSGSIRASKTLFRKITFKVIRMPLLWFDTTPFGEILKRFTADTRMVDDYVLVTMSEFADCLVKMMIVIVIG